MPTLFEISVWCQCAASRLPHPSGTSCNPGIKGVEWVIGIFGSQLSQLDLQPPKPPSTSPVFTSPVFLKVSVQLTVIKWVQLLDKGNTQFKVLLVVLTQQLTFRSQNVPPLAPPTRKVPGVRIQGTSRESGDSGELNVLLFEILWSTAPTTDHPCPGGSWMQRGPT